MIITHMHTRTQNILKHTQAHPSTHIYGYGGFTPVSIYGFPHYFVSLHDHQHPLLKPDELLSPATDRHAENVYYTNAFYRYPPSTVCYNNSVVDGEYARGVHLKIKMQNKLGSLDSTSKLYAGRWHPPVRAHSYYNK